MNNIRKARENDSGRIAEIEIFNYRLYFYPIFKSDEFYFSEMQVLNRTKHFSDHLNELYVYDDGVIKAFIQIKDKEVVKLFVEPVLHDSGIGSKLLEYAIAEHDVDHLWALEKNRKAISFYESHGFYLTNTRKPEEGTAEYLVLMER